MKKLILMLLAMAGATVAVFAANGKSAAKADATCCPECSECGCGSHCCDKQNALS